MMAYSQQPEIMAIGDSMYQGIRSLSFLPSMVEHSAPAQVARELGMSMTVPDLKQPLLYDLEEEIQHGRLLHILGQIQNTCVANLGHWPLDQPWSQHEAFDNIAIGGAQISSLHEETYTQHRAKLPDLIARLNAPHHLSIGELASTIGDLWYSLNNCYVLNPRHRPQQAGKTALDQVEERQPRILLINVGSNEGLFRAGFAGDLGIQTRNNLSEIPNLLRPIAERLRRLPSQTAHIVFNGLVRPRFIPNLMPHPEHENDFPGDGYHAAYGPRISSTQQKIGGDQLRDLDDQVARINAEAETMLRDTVGNRIVFADLYNAGLSVDGKHYLHRGLSTPPRHRELNNKPMTPWPFGGGFYGGLAGLDNMHPTIPGYAIVADAVLRALGHTDKETNKSAAFEADTLLNNFHGFPVLVAQAELSLLGTFGALRGRSPAPGGRTT